MNIDIVRAWKDPLYRSQLSEAQQELLLEHPIGVIELSDEELTGIAGGLPCASGTVSCCEMTVSDLAICCVC
jgi:mersacidin/lichenicidin family type 2 lantibiotic